MRKLILRAMLLCMMSSFCVGTALADDSDWELDSANGAIHRYNGTESDVVIPETIMGITITSIGKQAFTRAGDTLTSITMPDTITYIGEDAFENCRLLTTVNFSQNLERIEKDAFGNCAAVTQWIFPDSLQYIAASGSESSFRGKATYIRFPANTVTGVFSMNLSHATQIDIPDEFVGTIGGIGMNAGLMNEVTIPGGCTYRTTVLFYRENDNGNWVGDASIELEDDDFVFKVYNNTPAHFHCIDMGYHFELLGEWVQPTAGSSTSTPSTSTPSTSTPSTGSSSSSGSSSSATEESNPMVTLAIIGGVTLVLCVGVVVVFTKKK